jgi:hypothetical protein
MKRLGMGANKEKVEAATMNKPIDNATKLKPVVERAVKALYGRAAQNVKILKADRFPLFKEPKQGWLVHVGFDDDKHEYSVQMDVQIADGRITRSVELHRVLLEK